MQALRTYRRAGGLTLREMAAKLGVAGASLSRIERGEQWPDRKFFERVHAVTRGAVTPSDLIVVALSGSGRPRAEKPRKARPKAGKKRIRK